MTAAFASPPLLPEGPAATGPPETRGLRRDGVRMLVATPEKTTHTTFRRLGEFLTPGDVVVVNTSATRPAAIDGSWRGRAVTLHLSNRRDDGRWVVELRRTDGRGPILEAAPGDRVAVAGVASAVLCEPWHPRDGEARLWTAQVFAPDGVDRHMAQHGRPISYGYARSWPLPMYQTIFSLPHDPSGASAEMPSAGRPFTPEVVTGLIRGGISVLPITLHAGVSSPERHEPPIPEWFSVPPLTADGVTAARKRGSRVLAVGTTVTRALESIVYRDGTIRPTSGWTDLVLGPDRPAQVVTGLLTGWHPPEASHLLLLEAVAGSEIVADAYREAAESGYLWHEFGDTCLLLT